MHTSRPAYSRSTVYVVTVMIRATEVCNSNTHSSAKIMCCVCYAPVISSWTDPKLEPVCISHVVPMGSCP